MRTQGEGRSAARLPGTWREQAGCLGTDPDMFFPIGSTGPVVSEIEAAKAVCRSCPVIEQCLRYALETNQESGVWGGTTEEERRRLRRAWLAGRRRQSVSQ